MNNIKFGKNVIENLTSGMYQDSRIIYREYIQNSADQIDKALAQKIYSDPKDAYIDIKIDQKKRSVSICDNATGIKSEQVHTELANVADSQKKRGEDKGFRGIGRLGGLAYCEKLRFTTSYLGEPVATIMEWDASKCIDIINDNSNNCDAESLLHEIISYSEQECTEDKHFFKVELINIKKESKDLLNISQIKRYISETAPVPYSNSMLYDQKIYNYIDNNSIDLDEYKIYVNGDIVVKPYSSDLYNEVGGKREIYDQIFDLEFCEIKTQENEPLAWLWYGISTFEKQIPNKHNQMRGLRLRKDNIQIGTSDALINLFKEQRGVFYFIGEVQAIHPQLIPNGRRDYFNENEIRSEFEAELKSFFDTKLSNLYNSSSKIRSSYKKISEHTLAKKTWDEKQTTGFLSDKEESELKAKVDKTKKEAKKNEKSIKRWEDKAKDDATLKKILDKIKAKQHEKVDKPPKRNNKSGSHKKKKQPKKKPIYIANELTHLTRNERKIVSKIYSIISDNLDEKNSESLIRTIQKELKNNGKKDSAN